ncbi:nascent polypeptide-associated complex subunit alpha, muscle-specific form-like [Cyclospora cayetanensis]|uniref:Nascent polypeptide-associated complex subunit alpha, muscle-specific form-like n=1 Tax=Cyclospora cayetanensis TaxID=88456 RepID=A0A6P6RVA2_9EIME|nr:nascent polypeptide-associated complex subunit alpha, muscle-specific form-like [Cyclospora cayetanensis]
MLIYYRLSSEHAGAYRECPISGPTVTVAELKQVLARRCGFAAEFRRKIDFRVFLVNTSSSSSDPTPQPPPPSSNNTNATSSKNECDPVGGAGEFLVEAELEEQPIQSFSRVVLQRVVIRGPSGQEVLQHSARTELSAAEWSQAGPLRGPKLRLPPEWVCGLCGGIMRQPLLVKCASNCGHSACRGCIEVQLKKQHRCPFCLSAFRQIMRNKRLEEILKNVNPDDYEQPNAVAAGDPGAPGAPTGDPEIGAPEGTGGPPSPPQTDPAGAPHPEPPTGEASAETIPNGTTSSGVAVSEGGGAPSAGASAAPPHSPGTAVAGGPRHFVYLQPSKNLQLMRDFDLMVVDAASELAAVLASACMRETETAPAAGAAAAPAEAPTAAEEFFVVPCCLCGGGSSFSIGGFVRLWALNRVPSTDPAAADVLSQWQMQGSPSYAAGGGPSGVPTPACVLRVNWIEKYGRLPMLPARKQPLCGLFGGARRGTASTGGAPQGHGVLKRTALGLSLEVAVDSTKYEEVLSCVRDYVQYGSRSNEPWRQGAVLIVPATVQTGLGAPPVAAAGGPKPLGLPGKPPNPRNPFLGYTAILPFLSEEQFLHVRRLQIKALKRANSGPRGASRLEVTEISSASSGSSNRRDSLHANESRNKGRVTPNVPPPAIATLAAAAPAASPKRPFPPSVAARAGQAAAVRKAPPSAAASRGAPPGNVTEAVRGANAPVPKRAPAAPKRAAGGPSGGRRAPVVVPPPLKRLRIALGQRGPGTVGPSGGFSSTVASSVETPGSSTAPARKGEASTAALVGPPATTRASGPPVRANGAACVLVSGSESGCRSILGGAEAGDTARGPSEGLWAEQQRDGRGVAGNTGTREEAVTAQHINAPQLGKAGWGRVGTQGGGRCEGP